jgi:hypothetical protein
MTLKSVSPRLKIAFTTILLLGFIITHQAQNCFTLPQTGCCNSITFNWTPTITTNGTLITVAQTGDPNTLQFSGGLPCRDNPGIKVVYDYGDGSPISLPQSKPFSFSHTYSLTNMCLANSFTIQACISSDYIDSQTGDNYQFSCIKSFTFNIPPTRAAAATHSDIPAVILLPMRNGILEMVALVL